MSFPRYERYKDSGVEWLGDVPADWTITYLRRLVTSTNAGEVIDRSYWGGAKELLYTCAIEPLDCDYEGFPDWKKTSENDLLLTRNGTPYVHKPATGSIYTNVVQRVTLEGGLYRNYMAVALQNSADNLKGYGVSIESLNYEMWKGLPILIPSLDEQKTIAAFLDRETAKLDALIAEQQRLIELLKEKRQAVISHAVTKGLNPDAPMKDSGIEWLGEVPEHWDRVQLGRVCRQVSDGPHFSPNYVDEGVMFISARNISINSWSLEDAKFISESDYVEFSKRIVPERGDVLYTKGGTTGIARVVDLDVRFQVWVHVAVLKIERYLADPYYIAYALNSTGCYEQSQLHTRGATNQDLGLTRMIKIWLALPSCSEQLEITAFLDRETAKLDALITEAQTAITLLQERRTALISAAVTGKIDVRGLVSVQPEAEAIA